MVLVPRFIQNICAFCGQPYSGRGRGRVFCSMSCRMKQRNRVDNPAKRPEVRAKMSLRLKGKPLRRSGYRHSPETRAKISTALNGRPGINRGKHLPESTRAKLRAVRLGKFKGAENPNWRGGTSPRDWKSGRYKSFLHAVWTRDRGTCRNCGRKKSRMHVHHLESWIDAPDKRYDPDNGLLLCRGCHDIRRQGRAHSATAKMKMSVAAAGRARDFEGRFTTGHPSSVPAERIETPPRSDPS